jgi:hypothetical protein
MRNENGMDRGFPANEAASPSSADLTAQRENLKYETEEGVPRDVRPISSEPHSEKEPRNMNERSVDDQRNVSRRDQLKEAPKPNGAQTKGTQTNGRSDMTIETSATPDRNAADAKDISEPTALFSEFEINDLRSRWSGVQAGFVDSPRHSVEQADQLVAAVMQRISDGFARERSTLERQWDRGDSVSTEDLRVALQRYRVFFGRLLNTA